MKVLYILKRDRDATVDKLIETQSLSHDISVVDLYDKSADDLIDLIESHDRLIMW